MIQEIALNLLVPHPENCNHMDGETLEKLKRHIESAGRYEPLTVRPHPLDEGKFQVLNGHNRLRVLRKIGQGKALCAVWKVDDAQTRLYLATLNRLAGKEVPERRAILIERLLESYEVDDLSKLLPDSKKEMEDLEKLIRKEMESLPTFDPLEEPELQIPVILNFMLDEPEASEVNQALDRVIKMAHQNLSRSQALVLLSRFYLRADPGQCLFWGDSELKRWPQSQEKG